MDPKSWTQKWPFLRWWAALKMKESQCPERAQHRTFVAPLNDVRGGDSSYGSGEQEFPFAYANNESSSTILRRTSSIVFAVVSTLSDDPGRVSPVVRRPDSSDA